MGLFDIFKKKEPSAIPPHPVQKKLLTPKVEGKK
jgi:hypothetical protein